MFGGIDFKLWTDSVRPPLEVWNGKDEQTKLADYRKYDYQIQVVIQENKDLKLENARLHAEIERLKKNNNDVDSNNETESEDIDIDDEME